MNTTECWKEPSLHRHNNVDGSQGQDIECKKQVLKAIYCMFPLIWHSQEDKYSDGEQISGFQELGMVGGDCQG